MESQRGWNLTPGPSVSPMSQSTAVPRGSQTRLGQSLLIDLRTPGVSPRKPAPAQRRECGSLDWCPDIKACRRMWGDRGLSPDSMVAVS